MTELDRRDAMKLMSAGLALAAGAGCFESPGETIVPYAALPPELSPSARQRYATSIVVDGFATGVVADTIAARPIKVEGNPAHPASLGATTAVHQASVLDLYDPARARAVEHRGVPSSWSALVEAIDQVAGGRLWLLLPAHGSAVIARLCDRIRERLPAARLVTDDPLGRHRVYAGAELAFGEPLEVQVDFERVEVAVSLDADFLGAMPMSLRWSRQFAHARRLSSPGDAPARLLVAEPMLTPTGSLADDRAAAAASDVTALAVAIAAELGRRGRPVPAVLAPVAGRAWAIAAATGHAAWVRRAAAALVARPGAGAVIVGDRQPAACHAIGHWLNAVLGNLGRTVTVTEPALVELPRPGGGAAALGQALRAGAVEAVVIADSNPVLTSPHGGDLARQLARLPVAVHHTGRADDTSRACAWLAPATHTFEAWGDASAADGTASLIQPLVRPLYDSRSLVELLAAIAGDRASGHDLVRALWRERLGGDGGWQTALADGVIAGTARPAKTAAIGALDGLARLIEPLLGPRAGDQITVDLAPSPSIHDGRFAGNAWLQELPHPITKQTWGNAALMSPRLAARLGIEPGQVVTIAAGRARLAIPALPVVGHADTSITIELGHGGAGDDAGRSGYRLAAAPGERTNRVTVRATGERVELARTQIEMTRQGREVALVSELAAYRANPDFTARHRGRLPTLLPDAPRAGLQWAMSIDTNVCTGCSACVIACQAENNVPVVGRRQVRRGRAMHWLRIDTYFAGAGDDVVPIHQPMLCQHCEHAPCEYVCPVNATVHSPDGLNEMVYNRCVGTRFCSNNCPYKVRRFNFLAYTADGSTAILGRNPDVTVRQRGVMEKCTYCVQRIRAAEIRARIERRDIAPGEVVTACQQACPTGAILFGALEHTDTEMVRRRSDPRRYDVLHELGTRPRTIYLARIRDRGEADDG